MGFPEALQGKRDIVNLAPWWRLTVSLNDQPERMLVLPPLNQDLVDKIILLRSTKESMPMLLEALDELSPATVLLALIAKRASGKSTRTFGKVPRSS